MLDVVDIYLIRYTNPLVVVVTVVIFTDFASQLLRGYCRPISTTSSAGSLGRSQPNSPYCENTLLDSLHANQTFCHDNSNMDCSQSTDTHNTTVTNYFTQFNPQDQ